MKGKLYAFVHAIEGLKIFFAETFHARVHLIAAVLVVSCGFWLNISSLEWLVVLICIAIVFSLEAVNSAIEYTVDLITQEKHPVAKKAKDVSAAAVLIAAIFSIIIAVIIFYPKFLALWH